MHEIPGIYDDTLQRVVALFYDRVRADTALGPVFNDAIQTGQRILRR